MYCCEVEEQGELESIYRLRFEVYVEEMGRRQRHADPERRLLREPLDENAIHLAAFEGDAGSAGDGRTPVGALRLHLSSRSCFEFFEQLYGFAPGSFGPRAMVITRLITHPRVRGGRESAGLMLAKAAYRLGLEESVERGYIDCGRPLVPLFEWLGFDCLRHFEHPEYGEIAVMQIDPRDGDRLARTGSPFLELLEAERAASARSSTTSTASSSTRLSTTSESRATKQPRVPAESSV